MSTTRAQKDTLSHLQIKGLTYKCRSLDMCSREAFKSKESRCPTCAALLFGTRTCKRFRHTFKCIKHMPLHYSSHFPLNTHTHAVPFIKKVQNWWDFIWLFLSHLLLPQINEHLWNSTFCFSCFNGSLLKIQFSTDTLAPVIPITHFCTSSKVPRFIPKPGPSPWISLTLLTSRPETQSSSAQLYNVKSHRFNTVSLRK